MGANRTKQQQRFLGLIALVLSSAAPRRTATRARRAQGPFVINTQDPILQALRDHPSGALGPLVE